jgi:hypothetical protein
VKFSKGYTMTFGKGYSKIWTTELWNLDRGAKKSEAEAVTFGWWALQIGQGWCDIWARK